MFIPICSIHSQTMLRKTRSSREPVSSFMARVTTLWPADKSNLFFNCDVIICKCSDWICVHKWTTSLCAPCGLYVHYICSFCLFFSLTLCFTAENWYQLIQCFLHREAIWVSVFIPRFFHWERWRAVSNPRLVIGRQQLFLPSFLK